MRYNRSFKNILASMEIDITEFLDLVKLMYSDYPREGASAIIDSLHLKGKISENYLKNLLTIDVSLNED